MEAKEVIKKILKERGLNKCSFATMYGCSGQNITKKLRSDMKVSLLVDMLGKLGYEVVVQPKKAGRRVDGSYVLDGVFTTGHRTRADLVREE